jgi:transposase
MPKQPTPTPEPDFDALTLEEARSLCRQLWHRVVGLETALRAFQQQLDDIAIKKNSSNSSQPPSLDQKPNDNCQHNADKTKRLQRLNTGGRPLDPNPTEKAIYRPESCAHCGEPLQEVIGVEKEKYNKIELPAIRLIVAEVTLVSAECPKCHHVTTGKPTEEHHEPGSLFGSRLTALTMHLRFNQAMSLKRLQTFYREAFNLEVSQGFLVNIGKYFFNKSLDAVIAIRTMVQKSEIIASDETSMRVCGVKWWEWFFGSKTAHLHFAWKKRDAAAISHIFTEESLANSRPIVWSSDLYSSQMTVKSKYKQYCLAHQIRDLQYAIVLAQTAPNRGRAADRGDKIFSPQVQALFREAIHDFNRKSELAESTWYQYKQKHKRKLDGLLLTPPSHVEGRKLFDRFCHIRDGLLTFLDIEGVSPTNNVSEQALRWSVIYRKVVMGLRSNWGAELFANVRSIVGTGKLYGLSALASLERALRGTPFFDGLVLLE